MFMYEGVCMQKRIRTIYNLHLQVRNNIVQHGDRCHATAIATAAAALLQAVVSSAAGQLPAQHARTGHDTMSLCILILNQNCHL